MAEARDALGAAIKVTLNGAATVCHKRLYGRRGGSLEHCYLWAQAPRLGCGNRIVEAGLASCRVGRRVVVAVGMASAILASLSVRRRDRLFGHWIAGADSRLRRNVARRRVREGRHHLNDLRICGSGAAGRIATNADDQPPAASLAHRRRGRDLIVDDVIDLERASVAVAHHHIARAAVAHPVCCRTHHCNGRRFHRNR